PGNQRQGQARLLATGEVHHRLVAARAAEVETAEEIAQRLLALGRRDALQVQQRAGLVIKGVELVLGKIANHQILATGQAAAERLQLSGEALDQRRLARTVGAEQTDARARHQTQLDLLQHSLVAITQAAFAKAQQGRGDLLGLAEGEVERRVDMRRAQLLHAFQRLDPALRLTGLG